MLQSQALSILQSGVNVFLTGEPGSGKTHTVNAYAAYLRARDIEPSVTASTGIAATHIGGMTIHSWSGIGIRTSLDKRELNKIAANQYIVKRVRRAKVLIIDEVSMLSPDVLLMVDMVCREIRQISDSFGGIQVVLVGDFFQLPPVVRIEAESDANDQLRFGQSEAQPLPSGLWEEKTPRFAYDSPAWQCAKLTVCYLHEQYRQDDRDFLNLLSAIRKNAFTDSHLSSVKERKVEYASVPKNAPKLFSHNIDVGRVNDGILDKLSGEPRIFEMDFKGPEPLVAALKKGCLSPETLELKIGAAVMFTKNNLKEGFVNGTLGVVEGFSGPQDYPVVRVRGGKRIEVEPVDWAIEDNGKVIARITQVPLRLAWAITVHKSQGMSLDEAVMDLSSVFEFGQGYVALSRVRRFSGLYLLGWNERAFKVHPEVLARDVEFRAASEAAIGRYSALSEDEAREMCQRFISVCGGMNIPEGRKLEPRTVEAHGFEKIRKKYPAAYRSWSEAQDKQLQQLFTEGAKVADLAKLFNRTKGAISSRLKKLELN